MSLLRGPIRVLGLATLLFSTRGNDKLQECSGKNDTEVFQHGPSEEREAGKRLVEANVRLFLLGDGRDASLEGTTLMDDTKLLLDDMFSDEEIDGMLEVEDGGQQPPPRASCPSDIHITAKSLQTAYADRHIKGMEAVIDDPDCMSREFDAADPSFDMDEASAVFAKCRILVLKNAYDREFMMSYKSNITQFLGGIHSRRIDRRGFTTLREPDYIHDVDDNRWEVLMPRELGAAEVVANENVVGILGDSRNLGRGIVLHSMGGIYSYSQSGFGKWHKDQDYIFDDDHPWSKCDLSGQDHPAYAVQVMTPLMDLTYDHGPTQFCVGTSNVYGIIESSGLPSVLNGTLTERNSRFWEFRAFLSNFESGACPPGQWRTPVLNVGDAVMFDSYTLAHRGGQNDSTELRPVLYTIYSRPNFWDTQFVDPEMFSGTDENVYFGDEAPVYRKHMHDELLERTRFSLPREANSCTGANCEARRLEETRHELFAREAS